MGSDISLLTFMQNQNVTYKTSAGVAQAADQILYDNGDNIFRLRLFVNPNTNYSATGGAIQTTAYDIALAQQIKQDDPSAKFELDLHYSDTWADPGTQTTPSEWSADTTLPELQTQVYNYTLSTLQSFNSAGVMPDIVQVGNETNNGMLWPLGEITYSGSTATQEASWAAYGSLVNSAISAVHAAQGSGPKIQVSLVIGNGDSNGEPQYFYSTLTNSSWGNVPASSFDIMGVDYYPSTNDMSTLASNLSALVNTSGLNKKVMVMETAAPWEADSSLTFDPAYSPYTPANQAAYLAALAKTVQNVPYGDGMGLLYWYPESVQVSGYNIYNGGATALFNGSHDALPAVSDFGITQNVWDDSSGSANWSTAGSWGSGSVPSGSGIEADFLSANTGNETVNIVSAVTVGTIRFQNANPYTLSGTGSLSIQSPLGWGYIVDQQGAEQINVPTTIVSSTTFSVGSGCSLSFGAPVTVNSGQVLNFSGSGTINYQSSITVSSSASMTIGNSTSATALTLGTGAKVGLTGTGEVLQVTSLSNLGTIDLQTNEMLINYGSGTDPAITILGYLATGANGGAWNGTGIISSSAAANPLYGVGYSDGADGVDPNLTSGQIEVAYVQYGDITLSGLVNAQDFHILSSNFGLIVTGGWEDGDFLYQGTVNAEDFHLLSENFGLTGTGEAVSMPASDWAAMNAFAAANGLENNVPEPASAGLVLVAAGLLGSRRRNRSAP
jgi:arabinogalactan endo-1,4-beta-galactosidase